MRFHFDFIFHRNSCKQTVYTLTRRRVQRCLICVFNVCLGPKNAFGKYIESSNMQIPLGTTETQHVRKLS